MTRALRSVLFALTVSACSGDSSVQPDPATLEPEIASVKISFSTGVDPLSLQAYVPTIVTATVTDVAGRTVESGLVGWIISQHPDEEYTNPPGVRPVDDRRASLTAGQGCDLLTASIRMRYSNRTVEATTSVCGN